MSIRFKVILPYLLLTLVVAVIGVYVVTRLVSNTLSERLTNQLLEAGRVVSDLFVRKEVNHVDDARLVAYTNGLAEALQNGDHETVLSLVIPLASGMKSESLILIMPDGREILHLIVNPTTGKLEPIPQDMNTGQSNIVKPFLLAGDEKAPPRRSLGFNQFNQKYYYYTALPVPLDGRMAGVIVIGTSIDTMLPELKSTALADVILYSDNDNIVGTTLNIQDSSAETFMITDQEFEDAISADDVVSGENFTLDNRSYRLARGALQIGNDRIGVFAVVLPTNFVIESTRDNRNTYIALFSAVFFGVIVIGLAVTRLIIKPLFALVKTSQVIAEGNLDERTNIRTKDEIGTLATNFDEMTERLQERTIQLENTNEMLKRMDKTKTNFIQISAHELRTPLTLIMGYAQMLETAVENDPESAMLAHGILEGADRMNDIVNSMLDVSRIDNNALYLKPTSLQVDQLIEKVYRGFEEAMKERKIKFRIEGLKELPLISADPEMLQKVFYHLIMNAIKFTPDGGTVKVSGKYLNGKEPPQVELVVHDTGIGIDPEAHTLIFNKFYQTGDVLLHSSGKTKFKGGGPGLGLAIARGIIEAHGGRIWVESPGHDEEKFPGSAFHVSLPLEKKSE